MYQWIEVCNNDNKKKMYKNEWVDYFIRTDDFLENEVIEFFFFYYLINIIDN